MEQDCRITIWPYTRVAEEKPCNELVQIHLTYTSTHYICVSAQKDLSFLRMYVCSRLNFCGNGACKIYVANGDDGSNS